MKVFKIKINKISNHTLPMRFPKVDKLLETPHILKTFSGQKSTIKKNGCFQVLEGGGQWNQEMDIVSDEEDERVLKMEGGDGCTIM